MDTIENTEISSHHRIASGNNTEEFTIKELNDVATRIYYGAVVLFGILILPGIIGNLQVLHIYSHKKTKNNTSVYVILLATIDFIACGIVIPFNIANCLLPLMYYDNVSCKIFTCLNHFVSIGSAFALVAIAIERYRKICTPLKKQITKRYAELTCLIVALLAFIYSIPTLFLFGSTRIQTIQSEQYGFECHYLMELRNTTFQYIYICSLLVTSLICCVLMTVLYSLIGVQLWKQHTKIKRATTVYQNRRNGIGNSQKDDLSNVDEKRSHSSTNESKLPVSDNGNSLKESNDSKCNEIMIMVPCVNTKKTNEMCEVTCESSNEGLETGECSNESNHGDSSIQEMDKHTNKKPGRKRQKQIHRTSYMFFLITLCYLLSYTPYPILRTCQVLNMGWYKSLDLSSLIAFHIALCSPYISNVVNPIIYHICDSHYRREVKQFYNRLYRRVSNCKM